MEIDNQNNSPDSPMNFLRRIADTVSTEDLDPKKQLSTKIWEISEAGYCAGWTNNIEFFLWQAVLNGSEVEFGVATITIQELTHLRSLSEQSGGWWHWSDEVNGSVFVTLDKWQEIYQQFLEKQLSSN
jgi:hypothetical protein